MQKSYVKGLKCPDPSPPSPPTKTNAGPEMAHPPRRALAPAAKTKVCPSWADANAGLPKKTPPRFPIPPIPASRHPHICPRHPLTPTCTVNYFRGGVPRRAWVPPQNVPGNLPDPCHLNTNLGGGRICQRGKCQKLGTRARGPATSQKLGTGNPDSQSVTFPMGPPLRQRCKRRPTCQKLSNHVTCARSATGVPKSSV